MSLVSQVLGYVPFLWLIVSLAIVYIVFKFLLMLSKRALLKKARTKKQKSNIEIFARIVQYLFILILILFAIFSFGGDLTGFGLAAGLFSAALGWALQKPITGIAAWILMVVKRPFDIGDRIIIGNVRGDVDDISLTHIYLKETGGIVGGEENSGRIVMVPNSIMFEQNIINYTLQDVFTLSEVVVSITYESNLEKAREIALKAANKYTKDFQAKKNPYIRNFFQANGVNVHVRYFVPAKNIQKVSSDVTAEIHREVSKARDVEFAYPHTEVLLSKKKKK